MFELANNILDVLAVLAAAAPTLIKLNNWIDKNTKGKNVHIATTFANQIISGLSGVVSTQVQDKAVKELDERLQANNIGKHFTIEQVAGYINQAIAENPNVQLEDSTK